MTIYIGCCTALKGTKYTELVDRLSTYLGSHKGKIIATKANGICMAYNKIREEFNSDKNGELLVLMHDDLYLLDDQWVEKLRLHFKITPSSGIAGIAGAKGINSLKWWNSPQTFGQVYESRGFLRLGERRCEVDAVDGCFMALTPKAARTTSFDEETFPHFHGYDLDYCLSAKLNDIKTHVIPLEAFHATKGGFGDIEAFKTADHNFTQKWIKHELKDDN